MTSRRLLFAALLTAVAAHRALLIYFGYLGPGAPETSTPILTFAIHLWVPVLSLAAAAFIGLLRPNDPHALRASGMFLSLALLMPEAEALPAWLKGPTYLLGSLASAVTLPLSVMLLFLNYPHRSQLDIRLPWLKWVLPLGAALLLYLGRVGVAAAGGVLFVWISAFYATAMTAIGMSIGTARSPDERRRLSLMMWGVCAGTGPLFVIALHRRLGLHFPTPVLALLVLLLGLFPLDFVYVVVRDRVFGIKVLVRRGLRWALVSRGLIVLESALLFSLVVAAGAALSPTATAAIMMVTLAAFVQLNRRLQPAIDRRFFRAAYDARRVLTELSSAVRTLASNPEQLVDTVTRTVIDTLHPRYVAVFVRRGLWQGASAAGETTTLAVAGEEVPCLPVKMVGDAPQISPLLSAAGAQLVAALDPAKPKPIEASDGRLLVPMVAGGRFLGVLALGEKLSEEPWAREDRELLLTVADQTAVALDNAALFRRVAEQQKLEREVEIAREVQEQLWPRDLPPCATLQYWGSCQPARGVGGDYYDFLPLGDGRIAIALGDISGKGISAALLMSTLHATLKSHAPSKGLDPAALMVEVNRLLFESTASGRYATLFYGVYDERQRSLLYTNAGHVPPVLVRGRGAEAVERLATGGMVVGLFPAAGYENASASLGPDDLLLIFSDGVSEAESASGDMFGEERVAVLARKSAGLTPKELHDQLLAEVARFTEGMPPHDDTTLIVAKGV